ncbi:MAG: hypothetical protein KAJ10_16690, partial [Thermodesulfovibrionia bacterium]|nr:hypothetical protein [Thermodesulfovibrionia bacterium]
MCFNLFKKLLKWLPHLFYFWSWLKVSKRFKFDLLALITLSFITACHTPEVSRAFSEEYVIHYGENGAPSYIKGKNLTSHLDGEPHFEMLKRDGLYVEIVFRFLESRRELLKIDDPQAEFEMSKVNTDNLQFKHIKFQQISNSIPVWGREINVHLNGNNNVYLVQGHYEPTLKDVATTAKISEKRAAQLAIEAAVLHKTGQWRAKEIKKYIFMIDA